MKLLQTLTVCSIVVLGNASEASNTNLLGNLPILDMSALLESETDAHSTHSQAAVRTNAMPKQH